MNEEINNVKYYNIKTGQEVIYESDNDAKVVKTVDNIGTYNHASPENWVDHTIFDVIPYWLWGNSIDGTAPLGNRITGN